MRLCTNSARAGGAVLTRSPTRPRTAASSKEDVVHAAILRALLEGRLAPGAKLPEHRLARLFDVSREKVRKVLHRLVAERRLVAIPRRGVFAPAFDAEAVRAVYQAHRVFEAGVLTHLARLGDANLFERLEAHLAAEHAAAHAPDRAASVRLSGEFHMVLVDALGNPELSRFLKELLLRSSLMVAAFEPARLSPCGVGEHMAIAAALKAGDAERAIALSDEHFRHIEDRLALGVAERTTDDIEAVFAPPTRPRRAGGAPAAPERRRR